MVVSVYHRHVRITSIRRPNGVECQKRGLVRNVCRVLKSSRCSINTIVQSKGIIVYIRLKGIIEYIS